MGHASVRDFDALLPVANTRYDCFYVNVQLGDRKYLALLDSGANISVASSKLLDIDFGLKNRLAPCNIETVKGIGNVNVRIVGQAHCNLQIDGGISLKPQNLYFVEGDMSVPIILGMDFLVANSILMDASKFKVYQHNHGGSTVQLPLCVTMIGKPSDAFCKAAVSIGPRERKIIPLTVKGRVEGEGCLVPNKSNFSVAWGLAGSIGYLNEGIVLGEISNLSSSPITLEKGTKLGEWQPVCLTLETNNNDVDDYELLNSLEIDNSDLTNSEKDSLKGLILQYKTIFSDGELVGHCTTVRHHIDVGDCPPIKQSYRRLHPPIREQVSDEIKKLERQGVIQRSSSPWSSPLVPVRKKNGGIRICIDYRKLNSATKMDSFPLPNIEDCLSQFSGTKYFSTLDLLSGYHQVALTEDSKEKTAFATEDGLYQFTVMPQGACGSPATFQRLMNLVLAGISSQHAQAYLDDVLIGGATFEEHISNLQAVFSRLQEHGLKLNSEKCKFLQKEAHYLGHILSKEGIRPSVRNVEAVLNMPAPTTVRQVRRFTGMVNYYSRFIEGLATMLAPLYKLTSGKNRKVVWTEECHAAFEEAKRVLSSYPVLAYPRFEAAEKFILTTDGSGDGAGAVLSQVQDGVERPLGYASISFNKAQRRYSATDRELAALRFGVRHFKPYLFGREYIVRVDHQALLYLEHMKHVDDRLLRTIEDLNVGKYELCYIKGSNNIVADALSRSPLPADASDEGVEVSPCPEPIHVVAGGANSLFEAICWAMGADRGDAGELRSTVVDHLRDNPTEYGFTTKAADTKKIECLRRAAVFPGNTLLAPFVHEYLCNLIIHHNPGPIVRVECNEATFVIELECLGNIHYNVISRRTALPTVAGPPQPVKVLHYLLDDTECDESALEPDVGVLGDAAADTQRQVELPLLSKDEALVAISSLHEETGHPGKKKTLAACRQHFRTAQLWRLVADCIRSCEVCQRHKGQTSAANKEPMYRRQTSRPGELIAVDLMDMGRTPRGNSVLFVAVDLHSKFGYAVPLRSKRSAAVAEALEKSVLAPSICVPQAIISDGGPEFRGGPFRSMLEQYGVKMEKSLPYRPESNGAVERLNRTIRSRLATTLDGDFGSWDLAVHKVMVQYNRMVHDETGRAPVSYYTNLDERPVLTRKSREWRKAGRNFTPYSVGALVLKRVPRQLLHTRHKLASRFEGPFRIKKVISALTYEIEALQGRKKSMVVHFSQLKPYHGDAYTQQPVVQHGKRPPQAESTQELAAPDYSWLYRPVQRVLQHPILEDGGGGDLIQQSGRDAARRFASTPRRNVVPLGVHEGGDGVSARLPSLNFDTTTEGSFLGFRDCNGGGGADGLGSQDLLSGVDSPLNFEGFDDGETAGEALRNLRRILADYGEAEPESELRAVSRSGGEGVLVASADEVELEEQHSALGEVLNRTAATPAFTFVDNDLETWEMQDLAQPEDVSQLYERDSIDSESSHDVPKFKDCCVCQLHA